MNYWYTGEKIFTCPQFYPSYITFSSKLPLPTYFSAEIRIIKSANSAYGIMLGVSNSPIHEPISSYCGWTSVPTWGYFNNTGLRYHSKQSKSYGSNYGTGAIITIKYDRSKQLSYAVNGVDQGIAWSDLNPPMYLVASLYYSGNTIEILKIKAE